MDAMDIPAALIGVIGEKDAKAIANAVGHEVTDIYICEPSMKDYTDIMKMSANTEQSVTDQLGVIACIKDSSGQKLFNTELLGKIPITVGIRLCNLVMALIINMQKEANESLGKDMERIGIKKDQTKNKKSNSNSPSASN